MTEQINLKATTRAEVGKKVDQLRKQGKIPAVLYGNKIKPANLTVDYSTFEKVFKQAGESTLIDLEIDDKKPVKVLIQDYQLNVVSDKLIHVDFQQINMDKKLNASVELKFVGEPPAVKELGGVLVTNMDSLDVECLPQDLVHQIEIDLSGLEKLDDSVHVAEVKTPAGIKILNTPDNVIVLIQAPRTEQEIEALEAKPEDTGVIAEAEEGEETEADDGAEVKDQENKGKSENKPEKK